jgi:ubiquinone/menaquinone biosynthesis C-methylase UbiE
MRRRGIAIIVAVDTPALTPLAAAVLHVPVPERALLVGCGEGEPALFLTREFPAARVRGTDRSAALVRRAQSRVGLDPEGRVAFKQAKPAALPYPDGFFDLVAHVDGPLAPAEAARVLRSGGHFILASSGSAQLAANARERLLRRRLGRKGFVVERAQRVRDGNFFVARLDAAP